MSSENVLVFFARQSFFIAPSTRVNIIQYFFLSMGLCEKENETKWLFIVYRRSHSSMCLMSDLL